jgi:hypothetical protein
MINDPYGPQGAVRAPRLRVLSNNVPLAGAVKASVTTNNYYQCDHFSATFAVNAGVPGDQARAGGWCDVSPPFVLDVQVSLDRLGWQSLIIGEVDHQHLQIQTGTPEMEGRDLSARFIESKTQESFLNQTASQVATTLAGRHGMTAQATPTAALVGRYYEQDHSKVTLGQFSRFRAIG